MSKQSKFTRCLMEQLGYTNKIYGEEFFSPRQKELFPGLKRDLNMEIEDAARSDDPLEACMERRGYKPSKTQVFQEAISAKMTADMFGKQEKLTGAEAMFQEQMQECLDKLKNRPKLKFADIKSTMARYNNVDDYYWKTGAGKFDLSIIEKIFTSKEGVVVGTYGDLLIGQKIRKLYKDSLNVPIMVLNSPVEKGKRLKLDEKYNFKGAHGLYRGKPIVFVSNNPKHQDIIRTLLHEGAHQARMTKGRFFEQPLDKIQKNYQEYETSIPEKTADKMVAYAMSLKESKDNIKQIFNRQLSKPKSIPEQTDFINPSQMTLFGRITDSLPPILGWVGGKTRLANKIISMMPEHKVYVEPFLGGGSVFFKKPLADVNVINDLDKDLINFYKGMRNGNCEEIRACKLPKNKTAFNKAVKGMGKTVCNYLGVNKRSYGSNMRWYGYPKHSSNTVNAKSKCERYKDKLKQAKVVNKDYKDVVKEYDSKDTLCYIDPPYWVAKNHYGIGNGKIEPEDVANLVKSMKGKAIISYNDHPQVRKAFAGLNFHKVKTRYSIQTGATKNVSELLITNF